MSDDEPLDEAEEKAFKAACKALGINPSALPTGLMPRDIIDSAKIDISDSRRRGVGRPRKSDPVVAWTEVHDLLVYGEAYADEAGVKRHRYPGVNEIVRRYGVSKSSVQHYIRKHDIEKRRAEVKAEEDAIVQQHVVMQRAADRASMVEKVELIAHVILDRLLEGLRAPRSAPNHIRVDSVQDAKNAVELALKVSAGAGNDDESLKVSVTIDGLRDRHERVRTKRRAVVGATIGIVAEEGDDEAMVIDVEPKPAPKAVEVTAEDDPWAE